jgi:glycosyltransferase involved in cell wall biosynthesis
MTAVRPRPQISVVLPVHNERELLPELHRRLTATLERMGVTYELLLVNDGSRDGSWERILELANADRHTKAINLSRNFGHQVAITAGLDASTGETVAIMDSDLQDPPEVIPELYEKLRSGFDVVYAQRRRRDGETWLKRITATLFYRLVRRMTTLEVPVDTGDFRLISRRVADDLSRLHEHHRFIRGLVTWVGYNQAAVLYDRDRRHRGVTKFSLSKMIVFAFDGITSLSIQPLRFASHAGLLLSFVSLAGMVIVVVYKLAGGSGLIPGWTSLFTAMLFIGGIQLLALGLLGEYIGRIHDEVRQRPLYFVRDRVNLGEPTVPEAVSRAVGGSPFADR